MREGNLSMYYCVSCHKSNNQIYLSLISKGTGHCPATKKMYWTFTRSTCQISDIQPGYYFITLLAPECVHVLVCMGKKLLGRNSMSPFYLKLPFIREMRVCTLRHGIKSALLGFTNVYVFVLKFKIEFILDICKPKIFS